MLEKEERKTHQRVLHNRTKTIGGGRRNRYLRRYSVVVIGSTTTKIRADPFEVQTRRPENRHEESCFAGNKGVARVAHTVRGCTYKRHVE